MDSKAEETFPTPPPFPLSGGSVSEQDGKTLPVNVPVRSPAPPAFSLLPEEGKFGKRASIYHVNTSLSPLQPPVFSPLPEGDSAKNAAVLHIHSPNPPPSSSPPQASGPVFVIYETKPFCTPVLRTCPSCQTQVTTEVTFKVGIYAWLMCLVFVLCGLFLGCCLIPFFVNHFKDVYHTCPRCKRVLHIHRRRCCK
ncbi:lipopolysaccharide-induced tumor necrosis factor-alpha factor homolog [Nematolebias whitei]|uniref:lipopolysaccharide-induced tumor necrosis factor-alpha factor homolog n=1 Tax=Nematolebias whitei TaxID=451745 RepID=UPI00189AB5EC|nr:lipopolysaccharide-induced tumor necrosis factor-alpha factor homolog [Nematolebias whitei]